METPEARRPIGRDPALSGRFRIGQLAWWLPACALLGGAVAWFAVVAERYYAPLVAFPILVGVFLGGALVAMMRAGEVGHRPTILAGTLLGAAISIAGQHWLGFWQFRQGLEPSPEKAAAARLFEKAQEEAEKEAPEEEADQAGEESPDTAPQESRQEQSPGAALPRPAVPPSTFGRYLRWRAEGVGIPIGGTTLRGGLVWLIWAVDGLLVALAAGLLVAVTARLPYCDRCRTWYHTMRSGKIDELTTQELARLADVSLAGPIHSARYRLVACREGCGPTGLALSWEQPDGGFSSGYVWLDASGQSEVLSALEQKKDE